MNSAGTADRRRVVAVLATVVLVMGTWWTVIGVENAGAATTTETFTADGTFTVPSGVTSVQVTVTGAGGGAASLPPVVSGETPPQGGSGSTVTATVAVTPGMDLTVVVGQEGHDGTDDRLGGVGFGTGGTGGSRGNYNGGNGGGGGGGSAVLDDGTALVVAGGGGGGGGQLGCNTPDGPASQCGPVCTGLDAGSPPASPGPDCPLDAPPAGHDGADGSDGRLAGSMEIYLPAGGGGGGWIGGAAGPTAVAEGGLIFSGGGGGTNHTDPTAVSAVSSEVADNAGAPGRVVITYDEPEPTTSSSTPVGPTLTGENSTTSSTSPTTVATSSTTVPPTSVTAPPTSSTSPEPTTSPHVGGTVGDPPPPVTDPQPAVPIRATPHYSG